MQSGMTAGRTQAARVIGLIAATLIASMLIVAFVVANLGLGFEGASDPGRRLQPPASIVR